MYEWEREPDVGSAVGPVCGARLAAMGLGNHSHDRESEAGARATPCVVGPAEALERARFETVREAVARVSDVDLRALVALGRGDADRSRTVTQRVFDQVGERLLDPLP